MRNAILLSAMWTGAAVAVWLCLRARARVRFDPDMDTRRKVELLSPLLGRYVDITWQEPNKQAHGVVWSQEGAAGVLLAITEDVREGTAWLELDWGYGVDVNARGLVVTEVPRPTDLSHDHS
jgi:hypothetical protein